MTASHSGSYYENTARMWDKLSQDDMKRAHHDLMVYGITWLHNGEYILATDVLIPSKPKAAKK